MESWGDGPLEEKVVLWEWQDGSIIAVLNAEGRGEAYIQVHPDFQSPIPQLRSSPYHSRKQFTFYIFVVERKSNTFSRN